MTILLLRNNTFNKYKTIWKKDKGALFSLLCNENMFKQYGFMETRWEIVEDRNEVKQIIEENFSSIGRGEPYQEGLPSGTVISSSLYPVNLHAEIFKLQWLNNIAKETHDEQEKKNLESLAMGTWMHKLIELWLISPLPRAKRTVDYLVDLAKKDEEILTKIPNIAEKEVKYDSLAYNIMPNLIEKVLCKYDVIGSEVFINTGRIQGSIDLLCKRNGKYYIVDWKTTGKTYKTTGKRKFSSDADISDYKNQLCIYTDMLIDDGYIPECERENIEYRLYQIHLVSEEYKEFVIPNEEIVSRRENVNKVLDWIWEMKDGE